MRSGRPSSSRAIAARNAASLFAPSALMLRPLKGSNQPALAFIVATVASCLQQQQGLIASNDTKKLQYSTIGSI